MKRKDFPQITRQTWFPQHLKQLIDEFLTWFASKVRATHPFLPVIYQGLEHSSVKQINNLDLAIGAGIKAVTPLLDKNIRVNNMQPGSFNVNQNGLYTFINCFHLLSAPQALNYLQAITEKGYPIVVVEGNNDNWWQAIGMTVFVPLTVLLASPFVKPFRWTRLLFTYLIPVLPLIIVFDGVMALFRLYNPSDLTELTQELTEYEWTSGKAANGRGGKIIFLKGFPKTISN